MELKPIHPFPARMAPSIVWEHLPSTTDCLRILDPMVGSGTTLVGARERGHQAIGCDTDPLALLISQAWCAVVDERRLSRRADCVLERAKRLCRRTPQRDAYPANADDETKKFVRFWFDARNRRQLAALATAISRVRNPNERCLLWCAFSRLIITKTAGVSLAMDVSHSRPHRAYVQAPVRAFDKFILSVQTVAQRAPFKEHRGIGPEATVVRGDARAMPVDTESIDMVITSPPYLNAIDYMRGHKLSLVWMGHRVSALRKIRASNVGTERGCEEVADVSVAEAVDAMANPDEVTGRTRRMMSRYAVDINLLMRETRRVLMQHGRAVFVIGDSMIGGAFIRNSLAVQYLGQRNGLDLTSRAERALPANRRYLPPPCADAAGTQLRGRMRKEVILTFAMA